MDWLGGDFFINEKQDIIAIVQIPLAPTLKEEYPEVEEYARILPRRDLYFEKEENTFKEDSIAFADFTIVGVFKDLPDNVHLRYNGLISIATIEEQMGSERFNDRSHSIYFRDFYTYRISFGYLSLNLPRVIQSGFNFKRKWRECI